MSLTISSSHPVLRSRDLQTTFSCNYSAFPAPTQRDFVWRIARESGETLAAGEVESALLQKTDRVIVSIAFNRSNIPNDLGKTAFNRSNIFDDLGKITYSSS